jgi:hypothetical protein
MKRKKKKSENDNKEKFDFMKANKDNIKNIVRDDNTIVKLNEIILNVNKIIIHTYNLIKLYCLYLYENCKEIPILDKEFIMDVFKVITIRKCGSGGYREDNMPQQLKNLTEFYEEHYKETTDKDEILYYDKLSYILAYEAIDMEKNINVNIQEHFIQHFNKFVNVSFNLRKKHQEITKSKLTKEEKKLERQELNKEFKDVKNDVLSFDKELTSKKKYHRWITKQRKQIFDKKKSFDKDNIWYDLKSNTKDYLKPMIYIGKELEKVYDDINEKIENKEKTVEQIRLFNALPLRTNIVPKNICIDTPSLIQNFVEESTANYLKNYKKENMQYDLWNRFFRLNKKVFKKNQYDYNYMIKTDAISASILFIRLKPDGTPMKKMNRQCKTEDDTKYIEKTEFTEDMKKMNIVAIDPNMSDLIYCGMKDKNNNLKTFRYTQNQRRLETRNKKYMKIIDNDNKKVKINDKTIKEIESELSKYTCKTNNYDKLKEYLIIKNKLNITLYEHYSQQYFRKFKLNRFINTQKSEAKMINNYKNKFGSEKETMIVMGDYDKEGHMKGLEPVICKRFRRLFKNAGYLVYLVNEFRTSKLCNHCHEEIEPFLERKSYKPKDIKKNKLITVNGLLCHTDNKQYCELIHNRDKNAVQNMLFIVEEIKKNGKRPTKFSRSETNSSALRGVE